MIFLKGNHDELYLDFLEGRRQSYTKNVPAWIEYSIQETLSILDADLLKSFSFNEYYENQELIVCHANSKIFSRPTVNKWSYLDGISSYQEEAERLQKINKKVGVFAHTHDARFIILQIIL